MVLITMVHDTKVFPEMMHRFSTLQKLTGNWLTQVYLENGNSAGVCIARACVLFNNIRAHIFTAFFSACIHTAIRKGI